ncbi:hypothetical protein C8Q73DRAFT_425980 [Cubamyces lactineus]|nr:hypothetical protein C8Q73DRAFT_425980 [Cubamyces lactineus]
MSSLSNATADGSCIHHRNRACAGSCVHCDRHPGHLDPGGTRCGRGGGGAPSRTVEQREVTGPDECRRSLRTRSLALEGLKGFCTRELEHARRGLVCIWMCIWHTLTGPAGSQPEDHRTGDGHLACDRSAILSPDLTVTSELALPVALRTLEKLRLHRVSASRVAGPRLQSVSAYAARGEKKSSTVSSRGRATGRCNGNVSDFCARFGCKAHRKG